MHASWKNEIALGEPGRIAPESARRWLCYVAPIVRVAFRPRLEGVENLPRRGPFLLVANHSGLGNAELASLVVSFLERLGPERPIAAMVHPLSFNAWPTGAWVRRLGAIPSTYAAAESALASGVPVLVFPGGDHEAMRPIWQAHEVDFARRKGFLKIARKARVPIVPMGIRGSHFTAPVLWRSDEWMAKLLVVPALLGVKRHAVTLLGVLGLALLLAFGPFGNWYITAALAWLWLVSPLSQLPFVPWPIRIRIGTPIPSAELFASEDDAAEIDRAYEVVEGGVQALVADC
jgi:1-acyl-sn-glycerol-3-phosphate acyltransferase